MAMITFSGYPSSGKTRRANELVSFLTAQVAASPSLARLKVILINDESLGISKSSYDGARLLFGSM